MRAAGGPLRLFLAAAVLLFECASLAAGETAADRRVPLTVRFGNVDAIDAEDGYLAGFLRSIRNDGRFFPPLRTLIGPDLRNPTFFGISAETWMECSLLVPVKPGNIEYVWVFPVDNRNEYLTQLANQGLVEYEGMDGVSVLREFSADGMVRDWHLEWLPGNVAVFGVGRGAVAAARRIYAENSASRGLLAGAGGAFLEPDLLVRLDPSRLVGWQNREPGRYWWREQMEMLTSDLVARWNVSPARARLIGTLAEDAIAWPRSLDRIDCALWFEEQGVQWRLELAGARPAGPAPAQLSALRRLPERTAVAHAVPLDERSFAGLGALAGQLLLGAAGGAVPVEVRSGALDLFGLLARGRPRQMAAALVTPPSETPDLGATRLLIVEWEVPEALDVFWRAFVQAVRPAGLMTPAFTQLGWNFSLTEGNDASGIAGVTIRPAGSDKNAPPLFDAVFAAARNGPWLALAAGRGRSDSAELARVQTYRAEMAAAAANAAGPGIPGVRAAFTAMGPEGAGVLGFLDPVRFCQLALIEAADWRPHMPDRPEAQSTRLAREMLEYGSGGIWSMAGSFGTGGTRLSGEIPWSSLVHLSGALGITESIGME